MKEWTGESIRKALQSDDWETHMTCSPLREGLLNWYEFREDGQILELGAGSGALTGLFCDRSQSVTAVVQPGEEEEFRKRYQDRENLIIVTDASSEAHPEWSGCFDYVIAVDQIEKETDPAASVRRWMSFCKKDGILLLTAENRFGLKYFCGAQDPFTGVSYDGVNGYLKGSRSGRCHSRHELVTLIEQAGAPAYRMYYPVPDSRMPQMVFTDDYMNGVNAGERLVDYHYADPCMVGVEHRIFREMIDEGALPFLSDSFLVEIGRKEQLSDIIYAVATSDRGEYYGAATTIRSNGTVRKRALWKQGKENLIQLHRQIGELSACGVPVVRTELKTDSCGLYLEMPFIQEESLSSTVRRMAEFEPEHFFEIFDRINQYIRKTAEESGRVYLDIAPCNGFYCSDGSLLFYDQEFLMEQTAPEFGMFRTLKYCYAADPAIAQWIPLEEMYQRYDIREEDLPEWEAKEAAFIQSVRDMETYQQVFRWARPDYDEIYEKQVRIGKAAASKISEAASQENTGVSEVSKSCGDKTSGGQKNTEFMKGQSERKNALQPEKPYKIGYVPGVFDLFHVGHLNLLEKCKARCEYLIVGVLTDELVQYYKGHGCVISCEDRSRVIEALSVVDEVIPVDFSNTDKLDAWEQLHYDCHFSGDDHVGHWNDIQEELEKRGSTMEFFPYTQGISSTQIRKELKGRETK